MRRTASGLSERRILNLAMAVLFVYTCLLTSQPPTDQTPFISSAQAVMREGDFEHPQPSLTSSVSLPALAPVRTPFTPPTHQAIATTPSPTEVPTPPPEPTVAPSRPVPTAPPALAALKWPLAGGWITQYFSSAHPAVDIAAPYGTPIGASGDGLVTWAGWRNNGGGYVVEIDHGNGLVTGYNHLSGIVASAGTWVSVGTLIAFVGCTGYCTGPHIHFTLNDNGYYVDPLSKL